MSNPHRAITIEPVLLLYITALLLQLPTYQHYVYHRAKVEILGNNDSDIENSNHCNENLTSLNNEIQHKASRYILGIGLAGTFPSIFTSLLYGPLSDRIGRKPIMRLPTLGSLIDVCMTLATIYYELPIYIMAIGAAIHGLSGQYTTLIFTVTAYVADTTTNPSELSLRITRLEALALLGGTVAQATSGIWIQHLGYAAPYWFIFSCYLTTLLYITFSLPQSEKNSTNPNKSCYTFADLKLLAGVLVKKRDDRGRLKLIFLIIASVLLLLPVAVINLLVILYSKDTPLCWQAELVGYFLAALFFARAIGAVLCMKFLKWFNWHDYSIVQIGIIFLMGSLIMIGLSTNTSTMFLSTVLGLLAGLPQPCVRAQMSHIVDRTEQGCLFSIVASFESLCTFLAQIIFNPIYQLSLNLSWKHANGLVFFINSGIAIIPFIIISLLKLYQDRRQGYDQIDVIGNKNTTVEQQ